jgi:hypothetical protein
LKIKKERPKFLLILSPMRRDREGSSLFSTTFN